MRFATRLVPCARICLSIAAVWLFCSPLAQATTYDLSADWSTSSNPNGDWSYKQGATPLPLFQNNWLATGLNAWTTAAGQPPTWSRSTIATERRSRAT